MNRALQLASAMLIPSLGWADPYVPAIQASASATASAGTTAPGAAMPHTATMIVPSGMPPPIIRISPSAPLNAKEKSSAAQAAAWRNHNDKPARDEGGVLRWPFGASLPSVVCSPLQSCDVALQPGEVVETLAVGDKVRWLIMPAVSGSGAQRTTHLIIKPTDAGLISNVIIYTDTRVYSIKLVSTQTQWTPLTAFSYPEAPAQAWEKYGASTAETLASSAVSPAGDVDMDYRISGDAPWRPEHVYSIGGKTIVIFPSAIQYGTAPALIGLANDGSWLSSASEQMLRYRVADNRITIDGLPEHFKLVTGVGSSQTRVDVRRGK